MNRSEIVTFKKDSNTLQSLNQILYGPPGTGKIYNINMLKEEFIYREKSISDFEWATQIVENLTWFEVAALCLYALEKEASDFVAGSPKFILNNIK